MREDPETRWIYRIASHLGKTISEVSDLSVEEIGGWVAFLTYLNDEK